MKYIFSLLLILSYITVTGYTLAEEDYIKVKPLSISKADYLGKDISTTGTFMRMVEDGYWEGRFYIAETKIAFYYDGGNAYFQLKKLEKGDRVQITGKVLKYTNSDSYYIKVIKVAPAQPSITLYIRYSAKFREMKSRKATADEYYRLANEIGKNNRSVWGGIISERLDTLKALIYKTVLKSDPDHEGARKALGYKRYKDKWMTSKEIREAKEAEYATSMRAKGLIEFGGQWIAPDEKMAIQKERERQKEEREAEQRPLSYYDSKFKSILGDFGTKNDEISVLFKDAYNRKDREEMHSRSSEMIETIKKYRQKLSKTYFPPTFDKLCSLTIKYFDTNEDYIRLEMEGKQEQADILSNQLKVCIEKVAAEGKRVSKYIADYSRKTTTDRETAKLGMSYKRLKEVLRKEGRPIIKELDNKIYTEGEMFGEKVEILYQITPLTRKCRLVLIGFYSSSNKEETSDKVRKFLLRKFGKPYPEYIDGMSAPIWEQTTPQRKFMIRLDDVEDVLGLYYFIPAGRTMREYQEQETTLEYLYIKYHEATAMKRSRIRAAIEFFTLPNVDEQMKKYMGGGFWEGIIEEYQSLWSAEFERRMAEMYRIQGHFPKPAKPYR